jgi:hypothetical protein
MTFDGFGFWRESWTVPIRDADRPLREAVERFGARRALDLTDLPALETRSVRQPGWLDHLFRRDTESRALYVVAPGLLVWVRKGPEARDALLRAAPLAAITVERGMAGPIGAARPAARGLRGLTISGTAVGESARTLTFLGYGREPDGDVFEQRLREAMRDAGNPQHGLG